MGHERLGFLPHSRKWRDIVQLIANTVDSDSIDVSMVASLTIKQVRTRFIELHTDSGIRSAFTYLVYLAMSGKTNVSSAETLGFSLSDNPSLIRLVKQLNDWVDNHSSSLEYAELAKRSAAETIANWTRRQSEQTKLFVEDYEASNIWSKASNGAGFCELSRMFFANFTSRYLEYFLGREASSVLPTTEDRNRFSESLEKHIDYISQHAFETSKITQSFAAGWFNNHTKDTTPTEKEIAAFLAKAFNKINEVFRIEYQKEEK